jgi:hypothetical protein
MLIVFSCVVYPILGQDTKNLGKTFRLRGNYQAQKCNAVGGNASDVSDPLERNFLITVEAITETAYVISVPKFTNAQYNEKFVRAGNDKMYFLMPSVDFDRFCEKPVSRNSFAVGIPTIPAKLRFGNGGTGDEPRYFRFEGNVSLGLSAGYKRSFGEDFKNAFNVLAGFTVASVPVDPSTTQDKVTSSTNAASFSPHIGLVFEVEKFQIGLYTGLDFLDGELNKYWVYRHQPWLGIGIGYSIFAASKEPEVQDK